MEKTYIKYKNFREMPETRCGYCRLCGEKTLHECDIEGAGYKLTSTPAGTTRQLEKIEEQDVPICEDCIEIHKKKGDTE